MRAAAIGCLVVALAWSLFVTVVLKATDREIHDAAAFRGSSSGFQELGYKTIALPLLHPQVVASLGGGVSTQLEETFGGLLQTGVLSLEQAIGTKLTTAYREVEPDAGVERRGAFLFVHGLNAPTEYYANLVTNVAKQGFHTFAYDGYGRGFSDRYRIGLGIPPLVHQLYAFVKEMRLGEDAGRNGESPTHKRKLTLMGFSLGGMVVASFVAVLPILDPQLADSLDLRVVLNAPLCSAQSGARRALGRALSVPMLGELLVRAFTIYGGSQIKIGVEGAAQLSNVAPGGPDEISQRMRAVLAVEGTEGDLRSLLDSILVGEEATPWNNHSRRLPLLSVHHAAFLHSLIAGRIAATNRPAMALQYAADDAEIHAHDVESILEFYGGRESDAILARRFDHGGHNFILHHFDAVLQDILKLDARSDRMLIRQTSP